MESIPSLAPRGLAKGGRVIDVPGGSDDVTDVPDFVAFYEQAFDPAARLAFLLTGDLGTSEDIAQEALSRLAPRFGSVEHPRAYLRTVVVNLCSRARGRRARERETRERLGVPDPAALHARELIDVIDALPQRQRTVVVLRYFEDLSEAEIAATIRCRPGTVKSLAARALATLRQELS